MTLLLDTHTLLWWLGDDTRLSGRTRKAITTPDNRILVSVASAWELAIKVGLNRLKFPLEHLSEQLRINDFKLLPIQIAHATAYASLPNHHRDPFDRMLIAQAICEDIPLATADAAFAAYPVRVL